MATTEQAPAAGGSRKKLIILIVVGVLVLVGGAVGTTMWLLGGKEAKTASAKAKKAKAAEEEDAAAADGEAADAENADAENADAAAADGEGEDPEAADGGEEGKTKNTPTYVELTPAFVVNFQDDKKRARFLKAEISILVKSADAEEALKANRPAIRNTLVMLLSRQVYDQLMTPEGKDKLRADALVEVKAIVTKVAGAKKAKQVEDVFFSSLVMQ